MDKTLRMQWKNKKKNTFVAENARGSHFFCNLHPISEQMLIGEMLEWLKRVVAVPADLYEQTAGGQILIVEPVAEQDRAGEAGVLDQYPMLSELIMRNS